MLNIRWVSQTFFRINDKMHNELYKRNTSILILAEDRRFSLIKKVNVKQSIKEGRFPMRRKICDVGWRVCNGPRESLGGKIRKKLTVKPRNVRRDANCLNFSTASPQIELLSFEKPYACFKFTVLRKFPKLSLSLSLPSPFFPFDFHFSFECRRLTFTAVLSSPDRLRNSVPVSTFTCHTLFVE